MREQRNYKGESIVGIQRTLLKPEYGTGKFDNYGNPIVDWDNFLSDTADKFGFDITNVESNGKYLVEVRLPQGTVILRYGDESGTFTAPEGTPYEELALPYTKETMEYNEYKVIADGITVYCIVDKGKVAPSIDGSGGGVQYHHQTSIKTLVDNGTLERMCPWE